MQYAPTIPTTIPEYRDLFVGLDCEVPLLDGRRRCYINLDNAASTPCLQAVQQAVNTFLVCYSSVHRGTGFKSQVATHAYEQAREIVLRFVGADPATAAGQQFARVSVWPHTVHAGRWVIMYGFIAVSG